MIVLLSLLVAIGVYWLALLVLELAAIAGEWWDDFWLRRGLRKATAFLERRSFGSGDGVKR